MRTCHAAAGRIQRNFQSLNVLIPEFDQIENAPSIKDGRKVGLADMGAKKERVWRPKVATSLVVMRVSKVSMFVFGEIRCESCFRTLKVDLTKIFSV